jgi:hypothetical protein
MKLVGYIALLAGMTCLTARLHAAGLTIAKIGDSTIDAQALIFTNGTWSVCVNGQTFQQDAVTSFQGFQYATYYDAARKLCVARRKVGAGEWQVIRFADHRFKGNDTHNVSVIGICEQDGTIHLSFDHHGGPLHYRVSRAGVALRPEEFAWSAELFGAITSRLEPGKELKRVTYPRFLRTPGGGLQFGCRIGSSGNGEKCLADYEAATGTWKNFGAFAGGSGVYEGSKERNPYLNGLSYDATGRLHVTWCWRETGDPMTNHDLDYAWSDDRGVTWRNNDGQEIGKRGVKPVVLDSPGVRVVEIPMKRGLINATTQALDRHNRIHLVTFHLPDAAPAPKNWENARQQSHFFHYWRADDGKWHRNEVNAIGSRPQLWFDEKENAYLVFVGDRFNPSPELTIAAASAASRWRDWKIIHRERGPFSGQPQVDRHGRPGVLSIYIQEAAAKPTETSSPLRVLDFKP